MNNLNKGKENIYQRLHLIQENGNNTDDQELNLLLDSLRVLNNLNDLFFISK